MQNNKPGLSPHAAALLTALFVTFLWSLSFVLIKIGLRAIPALAFAGLRYGLAFAVLLAFAVRGAGRARLRALTRADWLRLALLGVVYYTLTQGAQFVALDSLPAATLSLMLSFSAILVAFISIRALSERPSPVQWFGIALYLAGALVYFTPVRFPADQWLGLAAGMVAMTSNALSSILGRAINRGGQIDALTVTVTSMGFGAALLLTGGLALQGLPPLTLTEWGIVIVLAVFNSALAFTLWNRSLRVLSAFESSTINNSMLAQIALLAWVFLGETLSAKAIVALVVAMLGTILVQVRKPLSTQRAVETEK